MKTIALVAFLVLSFLIGCSSPPALTSRWGTGNQEPAQSGSFYVKDQNISVSVQNDAEYLSLTVGVGDRMKQRQIFFRGLTVWFDRKGGDEKRFGIQYPLAAEIPRGAGRRPDAERAPDTSWAFPENIPTELEIFGPGEGEHHRMQMAETKGISVAIDHQAGTMFYTVKVPLMDNGEHLYGIGAAAGSAVGIGIESGGFTRPQGEERAGEGMGGGTPGGGMGRGRRGGGGGGGGGGGRGYGGEGRGGGQEGPRSAPEPLKFWGTVILASPNSGN